jgi:predicted RNA-binding protein with PUA domain
MKRISLNISIKNICLSCQLMNVTAIKEVTRSCGSSVKEVIFTRPITYR